MPGERSQTDREREERGVRKGGRERGKGRGE